MSIRVMTQVWDSTEAKGTDRLVLLAIADSADDDGSNAWPSMARLAHKARVSERTVQRSIRTLETMGLLAIEDNAGGTANTRPDRRPNRYTVLVEGCQSVTPSESRGDIQRADGVTSSAARGDAAVRRTVLDPSKYPSIDALQAIEAKFPAMDVGWQALQFRDHHLAKGSKMADWDKAFWTWCRNSAKWTKPKSGRPSVGDQNIALLRGGLA